ncbi:hypothetical protein A9O66_15290 [Paraburkholderia caribensis]|uniref:Uncharacterized protein n=1 Tax=Paraburkholderia caribensis TaxID=75105 RepID=A0A9Q6S324_9BURK|nr:hypothetical protein A9O66_15290 [Paraburkholderia caribensis]
MPGTREALMKNKRITCMVMIGTPIIAGDHDFTFDQHTDFMNRQIGQLERTGIALPDPSREHIVSIGKSSQRMRRFSAIENHISRIMQCRLQASSARTLRIDTGKGNVAHIKVSRMNRR